MSKLSAQISKEIRSFAMRNGRGYSAASITVVDGSSTPSWKGEPGCYRTKTGIPVRHPNAYRKAWGKPIYVPSTRHIVVGKLWIKQLEIDLIQVQLGRKRHKFVSKELAEFIYYFGNHV